MQTRRHQFALFPANPHTRFAGPSCNQKLNKLDIQLEEAIFSWVCLLSFMPVARTLIRSGGCWRREKSCYRFGHGWLEFDHFIGGVNTCKCCIRFIQIRLAMFTGRRYNWTHRLRISIFMGSHVDYTKPWTASRTPCSASQPIMRCFGVLFWGKHSSKARVTPSGAGQLHWPHSPPSQQCNILTLGWTAIQPKQFSSSCNSNTLLVTSKFIPPCADKQRFRVLRWELGMFEQNGQVFQLTMIHLERLWIEFRLCLWSAAWCFEIGD